MFCGYCGKQLDDQAKFCPYCGKPTQAAANNAGSSAAEGAADNVPYGAAGSAPYGAADNVSNGAAGSTPYGTPYGTPYSTAGSAPHGEAGDTPYGASGSTAAHDVNHAGPAGGVNINAGTAAGPGAGPAKPYITPPPTAHKSGPKIDLSGLKNLKLPSVGADTAGGSSELFAKIGRYSGIAAAVIMILSGFLPFLKVTEDWELYAGWVYNVDETVRMISEDMLPFWIVIAVFGVLIIVSAVIKKSIVQIVASVLELISSFVFIGLVIDYMDDSRVRMVYQYASGRVFLILGILVLLVSLVMTFMGIVTKKNVPSGRPVGGTVNRPSGRPVNGPVNNRSYSAPTGGPAGGSYGTPSGGPANGSDGTPSGGPANGSFGAASGDAGVVRKEYDSPVR